MERTLRPYFAELVGALILVCAGAGSVCATYQAEGGDPLFRTLASALAEGAALAVAVTASSRVSAACFNPALTLMLWVFRRLDGPRTLALALVQLAGGVLGGLAVRLMFPENALLRAWAGTPHLQSYLAPDGPSAVTLSGLLAGAAIEALFTAFLAFAVFATLLDRRGPRMGGLGVGLAQAVIVLVGFRLTGGAANPARYFGPGVWQYTVPSLAAARPLADHLVYWAGPIVGALAGGWAYGAIFRPPQE
jgi:glycerol uptake facilitator-like aquaporin